MLLAKYFEIGAFRLGRLTSFLDPWADPTGDGWQVINSLYAIGSGGLFGARTWKQYSKIFISSRTTK